MTPEKIIGIVLFASALISLITLLFIISIPMMKTEKENKILINKKTKLEIKELQNKIEQYEMWKENYECIRDHTL